MIIFNSLGNVNAKNAWETVKNTLTVGFILIDKNEFVNVMCGGQNNSPKDVTVGIWGISERGFCKCD